MADSISKDIPADPINLEVESKGGRLDFGPNSRLWTGLFLAIVALLACYFYRGANVPWVGNDNYYGAIYAQAAHNNLRAGVLATGGVPATLYFGPLPIPVDAFYVHHPTLLPLLETASFAIFGEAEWSARLVPVSCSLLSILFIWLLVSDTINRRAATFAAIIFATLPMELHYGDMVDFEPCLVMLMLAALLCLRRWDTTGAKRWAWLAALCCFFALWMDWPGYLFVLSLAGWFFLKGTKTKKLFAVGLIGLCGLCGVVFLLQIRHVNPAAWSDLFTALKMRLGNGEATGSSAAEGQGGNHFTLIQWCVAVRDGMHEDFLILPWILVALGTVFCLLGLKKSEGMRWIGWAALQMGIAGVLYVVILRNESFIHDFTTFYLIGSVAIMGGIALESIYAWFGGMRVLGMLVMLVPVGWLGYSGYKQSQLGSQFFMLDGVTPEPENLIPDLGRKLNEAFPLETTILCNFDPYTSVLPYYAQRTIVNNLTEYDFWKDEMNDDSGPFGGVIWLDAPNAAEIVASLPQNEIKPFDMDGFHFALWLPTAKKKSP